MQFYSIKGKYTMQGPKSGSVLVGVVWIQVILTVVVVGVLHSTRIDLNISKHQTDKVKAYYLALAGSEKAKAKIYQSRKQRMQEGINHKDDLYKDVTEFKESDFGGGMIRIGYEDPDLNNQFVYGVIDLERYLNINTASIDELKMLPGFDEPLGPLLVDYRDRDSEVSEGGFENTEEVIEDTGYMPKNKELESLAEVLLIPGANPILLHGEDSNFSNSLEPNEDDGQLGAPLDDQNNILSRGWAQYVTPFSGVEQVDARGNDRVNVKEAGKSEFSQVAGISEDLAKTIVDFRKQNEFNSVLDLLKVRQVSKRNSKKRNRGRRDDDEDKPQGPRLISQELLIESADRLSAGSKEGERKGSVNINTADSIVLSCLPGVTPEIADAIIRERTSTGYFNNITELLRIPGLGQKIFRKIEQKICVRSETFKIISHAIIPSSEVSHKLETIVKIDSGEMTTVSFRNLN